MKLLALDFDGVVSDSASECLVVAGEAYHDLEGQRPALSEAELFAAFVERMPLGNRAEDFGVVLRSLDENVDLPDQATYDRYRAAIGDAWLAHFHTRFYEVRRALAERDPTGWRRLMRPYPALVDTLTRRAGSVEMAIATAKDGQSVRRLLGDYGLTHVFREDAILDKETGVHKTAHLQRLGEICGLRPSEITFVDDKLNHLERASALGVRCVLAAWGYNGVREQERARELGLMVCDLDDFEARVFP